MASNNILYEEEIDGQLEDDSTDSLASATQSPSFTILPSQHDLDSDQPYLMKRMSVSGGSVFYRTRNNPTISNQNQTSIRKNQKSFVSERQTILQQLVSMKISTFLMILFILLLILLFFSSIYLVLRLDFIQAKVDLAQPPDLSHPQKMANWQILLRAQTSRKVQEYLDINMDQISQVQLKLCIYLYMGHLLQDWNSMFNLYMISS